MGAIPMKRSDIVADAILNAGEAEAGMPAFDSGVRIVSHMWCGQFVAAIGSGKSDAAALDRPKRFRIDSSAEGGGP